MKKSFLSIIILALLVVNIVLTSIMMLSVMNTNKKTGQLVSDIATVLQLDLTAPGETEETQKETVPIEDIETYDIADLTIPLKAGEDGKDHYALLTVSLSKNTKSPDYKTYGDLTTKESLIKSQIIDTISSHTLEEIQDDTDTIKEELLTKIQAMYNSDFIFDISFSSVLYQ